MCVVGSTEKHPHGNPKTEYVTSLIVQFIPLYLWCHVDLRPSTACRMQGEESLSLLRASPGRVHHAAEGMGFTVVKHGLG